MNKTIRISPKAAAAGPLGLPSLDEDDRVYTTAEAAPLIHPRLSYRTMERWRKTGDGPLFIKIGRRVGYTGRSLKDYKHQQTRRHAGEGR